MFVDRFLKDYSNSIVNLYNTHDIIHSFEDFINNLKEYLNKHVNENTIYEDLFYRSNEFCKQLEIPKEHIKYVCPACMYLGLNTIINTKGNYLSCSICEEKYNTSSNDKNNRLYKTFKLHSKSGYRCPDCDRFLPESAVIHNEITCPYFDCCFIGSPIKKKHHPKTNIETQQNELKAKIYSNEIVILNKIINEEINFIHYSSNDFTTMHKICVCKALKNLLFKYQDNIVDYLLNNTRSGGFQNKIFQEYVSVFEKSIPYCYKKGKTLYRIESLLESNIFNGISEFEAKINEFEIKNNTKEFYIGGRKGSYAQPFYIGKLIDVTNNGNSILDQVESYNFSRIKMKIDNLNVKVTHLRVYPHYQMGSMVYINRIRKNIVEKCKNILNSETLAQI